MEQNPAPAQREQLAGAPDSNVITERQEEPPSSSENPLFLPNEIMSMIVQRLRLPIHGLPHTIREEECLSKQRTLHSLCLTSKLFCEYATPLLYETIILFRNLQVVVPPSQTTRLHGMVLLIRTLLEKPDFCQLIKNIICPTGFGDEMWFDREDPGRHPEHI
ncbi:hypothetical protein F4776DRAFT_535184 [Hypoxylon sp. NC0597]|nr:hypothetical protein F4776DRAFT_535184 [Hypoxylon sp. NC0597]